MSDFTKAVQKHYSKHAIYPTVLAALEQRGIGLDRVRTDDLFAYDQFHAGGIDSTRKLARLAGIEPGAVVIDVGCGAGGSARFLRTEMDCRVFGLDLSPSSVSTALRLNRLAGIRSVVDFACAQAEHIPLRSGLAHYVWTQHVTMNMGDHAAMLDEVVRLLKPGGCYAGHEWLRSGNAGELPYPMPWAPDASANNTIVSERFLKLLGERGFSLEVADVTAEMQKALKKDRELLRAADVPAVAERIPRLENLIAASRDGLMVCWMIVAKL